MFFPAFPWLWRTTCSCADLSYQKQRAGCVEASLGEWEHGADQVALACLLRFERSVGEAVEGLNNIRDRVGYQSGGLGTIQPAVVQESGKQCGRSGGHETVIRGRASGPHSSSEARSLA